MPVDELENFSVLADDFFTEYLVRNNIDVNQELKKVLEKRAIFSRSLRNPLRSFAIQYFCNAKNTKGYAKLRKVFRFLLLIRIIDSFEEIFLQTAEKNIVQNSAKFNSDCFHLRKLL